MEKLKFKLSECKSGDILAEDILVEGIRLVTKNTTLNSYIIEKLSRNLIFEVSVYKNKKYRSDLESELKDETQKRIKSNYGLSVFSIKSIISKISTSGTIDHEAVESLSNLVVGLSKYGSDTIKYLRTLRDIDEYTYTHCVNVALYSSLIGTWMNLSSDKIYEIAQAGLLHDIGKINIEENILKKPDRLTSSEFYEVKNHTIYGYDIVNNNNSIGSNIKQAILMHHERIDGTGYPFGLINNDIPLYARLVAVADVFDAMVSDRVYKRGVSPFKAFQMFLTEGIKLFDTSVIFTMLENLSAYYIGMNAVIDDGQIGEIVYIPPKNVLSPIIKVNDILMDFSKDDINRIIDVI